MTELVAVGPDNVDETSFFCLQSKPKSPGFLKKRKWLDARFREGLQIQMLGRRDGKRWSGERGFIEYIPGEFAWRGIDANDYMVIHCLWVVGKSRGKGGSVALLEKCMRDAKKLGLAGVATVTAENGFAASRKFYEHHGFELVAESKHEVALMRRAFSKHAAPPALASGAKRGPGRYDKGLTIFRSDQCPYIEDATRTIADEAKRMRLGPVQVVELKSASAVRKKSPTPYGVFGTTLDGKLLSYRYMTPAELKKAVTKARAD